MKPKIALFQHHPECSRQCCDGMIEALGSDYEFVIFSEELCRPETFSGIDIVAFPGGIGDVDSYDTFFRRKAENAVADFVANGGKYLGICMGAYWAGSQYFDILDSVDAEQYIKRSTADIKRSYGTAAKIQWNQQPEEMFFYDGCALVGDETKFKTVARYSNGDPMAIIQGRIGLIGCHPESQKFWYEDPYKYIDSKWHQNHHHKLLLEFVNSLMYQ
jgi:glutamine amidotransferase-like uncharacterized protein